MQDRWGLPSPDRTIILGRASTYKQGARAALIADRNRVPQAWAEVRVSWNAAEPDCSTYMGKSRVRHLSLGLPKLPLSSPNTYTDYVSAVVFKANAVAADATSEHVVAVCVARANTAQRATVKPQSRPRGMEDARQGRDLPLAQRSAFFHHRKVSTRTLGNHFGLPFYAAFTVVLAYLQVESRLPSRLGLDQARREPSSVVPAESTTLSSSTITQ
jgi:hypothetical protein